MQITVVGAASKREINFEVENHELSENLLEWLRARGVMIASSCSGEGICKKCIIQNGWLSCKLTLKLFFEREPSGKILVDYL